MKQGVAQEKQIVDDYYACTPQITRTHQYKTHQNDKV